MFSNNSRVSLSKFFQIKLFHTTCVYFQPFFTFFLDFLSLHFSLSLKTCQNPSKTLLPVDWRPVPPEFYSDPFSPTRSSAPRSGTNVCTVDRLSAPPVESSWSSILFRTRLLPCLLSFFKV